MSQAFAAVPLRRRGALVHEGALQDEVGGRPSADHRGVALQVADDRGGCGMVAVSPQDSPICDLSQDIVTIRSPGDLITKRHGWISLSDDASRRSCRRPGRGRRPGPGRRRAGGAGPHRARLGSISRAPPSAGRSLISPPSRRRQYSSLSRPRPDHSPTALVRRRWLGGGFRHQVAPFALDFPPATRRLALLRRIVLDAVGVSGAGKL